MAHPQTTDIAPDVPQAADPSSGQAEAKTVDGGVELFRPLTYADRPTARRGLRRPGSSRSARAVVCETLGTFCVPGSVWTWHSLAALRMCLKTARIMPLLANNYKVTASTISRAVSASQEPTDVLCTCGHARSQHDSISSRYCDATASGGLDRGCVCRAVPGAYPGRM